jgi:hypothetical protein
LAPLKLGEPILRKSLFKIGSPKVRGANISKNLYSKLAPLKLGDYLFKICTPLTLGEPILNKDYFNIGSPKVGGANFE